LQCIVPPKYEEKGIQQAFLTFGCTSPAKHQLKYHFTVLWEFLV